MASRGALANLALGAVATLAHMLVEPMPPEGAGAGEDALREAIVASEALRRPIRGRCTSGGGEPPRRGISSGISGMLAMAVAMAAATAALTLPALARDRAVIGLWRRSCVREGVANLAVSGASPQRMAARNAVAPPL
mmetsp:Transcript_93768/g.260558  ORF Transcript_93768/g.260558 Transcript_93768/m.260558 type:complete len:137 (-) Transcript_93768:112-522(-)